MKNKELIVVNESKVNSEDERREKRTRTKEGGTEKMQIMRKQNKR